MPASSTLEDMLRRNAPGSGAFAGPSFTGPSFTGPQAVQPPQGAGPSYTAPTLAIPPFPGQPRPDGAGAPLPVGAPVNLRGIPGLYESVPTRSENAGQLPGSAGVTPSRYTMVQTNPIAARGPQPGTGAARRGTATMEALAQIYGGGQMGGAEPGGRNTVGQPDGVSPAQAAAYFAEQNRGNLARNDEMRRLAPNLPSQTDTPEVRASKQAYVDKILREQGGADPADLAQGYRKAMQASRDPRRVNLGVDAKGNPVERIVDANGNSSALPGQKEDPTEIERLQMARDRALQAGRADLAEEMTTVIKNLGGKADAYGRRPGDPERDPFDDVELPTPKTRAERDKLPPGTRYTGPDGFVHTTPAAGSVGAANEQGGPGQASRPQAQGAQIDYGSADAAALKWAQKNPNDARAAAILRKARGAAK